MKAKKDEEKLMEEIAQIEMDEDEMAEQNTNEISWIIERLCDMNNSDFKNLVRSIKYQRKAIKYRREMRNA